MSNKLFDNYLKKQVFTEEDTYIDLLNNITNVLTEEKIKFEIKELEIFLEEQAEEKKQELIMAVNKINFPKHLQTQISEENISTIESNMAEIILLKLKDKI